MIKQTLLFLFFIWIGATSHAQNYDITWGDFHRSTTPAAKILPLEGSNFYTLRSKRRRMLGSSLYLKRHHDYAVKFSEKLDLKVNGSFAQYEGILQIGERIYLFLSDRTREAKHLYMQRYDGALLPAGEPILVADYEIDNGKDRGSFDVIQSRDGSHFGVIYTIPGKKEERDRYGYKVYTENMVEVSSGDYKLPYEGDLSQIMQHYLSNSGDYFIAVTEYQEGEKKLLRSFLDYKALHVMHIMPDDFEQITIDLEGKRVERIVMNSDNEEIFTFTGIYGKEKTEGIDGMFFVRFDFKNKEVLDRKFEAFDDSFITEGWSQKSIEKAKRNQRRGKGSPQLHNYVMRQCEILEDGALVGSIEQFYVVENSQTDPRTGMMQTSYMYYYNDIICFKIDAEGQFEWLKKIPKRQVSVDDGGYYSSYSRFIDGKYLYFLFNDHEKNYEDNGEYRGQEHYVNFKKKKTVPVLMTVNLETGEEDRRILDDAEEIEAMLVPKKIKLDFRTGEAVLYAITARKEKFGLLRFLDLE